MRPLRVLTILAALALPLSAAGAAAQDDRPPLPPRPERNDPALKAEMVAALPEIRAELPFRIDEVTAVTAIRVEGNEFVYEAEITEAFPASQIDTIRGELQRLNQENLCGDPAIAGFVRGGGSMNHRYTDAAGNRFETRVVSCP